MPRNTRQFWKAAEDWSRRKHLILSYYLTPAAPKLRTQSRDGRVLVLDGFAGRGKYEDGSPGSPIYMGQLADECRRWSSPVELIIHNIEPDATSFQDLESCTKQWAETGYIVNRRGTFQQHLPAVLEEAVSTPLFAFLDPFRPSHLSFQDILPLLARTDATEVCLVFHTPAVMRILEAVRPSARTPEKTKMGLAAHLDEVFGGRRWERLVNTLEITPDEVISCLAEEVKAHVRWGSLYICWHGIQARYQVGLKYHIVFLTRHPDGVRLMNDAFVKEQRDIYEKSAPPKAAQLGLAFEEEVVPVIERTTEDRLQSVYETLIAIGTETAGKIWRRTDLTFESIIRCFGDFSQAEHRQAVDILLHHSSPPRLCVVEGGTQFKTGKWRTNDNTTMRFEL